MRLRCRYVGTSRTARESTQRESCVVIPSVDESGNLPPGLHPATWDEIVERYATSERRGQLVDGCARRSSRCARRAAPASIWTAASSPTRWSLATSTRCWEERGVDPDHLDPVLLDFSDRRAAQKAKYGGEFFPAEVAAEPGGTRFLDYFQHDRATGEPKGIIAIDLEASS